MSLYMRQAGTSSARFRHVETLVLMVGTARNLFLPTVQLLATVNA